MFVSLPLLHQDALLCKEHDRTKLIFANIKMENYNRVCFYKDKQKSVCKEYLVEN